MFFQDTWLELPSQKDCVMETYRETRNLRQEEAQYAKPKPHVRYNISRLTTLSPRNHLCGIVGSVLRETTEGSGAIHLFFNDLMPAVKNWNERAFSLLFSTRRQQTLHLLSAIRTLLIPVLLCASPFLKLLQALCKCEGKTTRKGQIW